MNNENLVKLPKQIEEINSQLDSKANEIKNITHLINNIIDGEDISDKLQYILNNSSGEVKIKSGTFLISKEVEIKSNTVLRGDGINKTILKIKDNSSNGTVATHGIMTTENGGNNISVEGITFDGNMQNQSWTPMGSANYGLSVRSHNTIVKNCEFKNVTGNGCGVPITCKNVIFDRIFSHDNGKKGLHSGEVENIQILNGFYYNNGIDSGIGIHQGMKKATIIGNHCFNNGTYGINLGDSLGKPSYNLIVSNNICYDNNVVDIFIDGRGNTEDLLIKDCVVSNNICRNKGITITSSKNVSISNNLLINANVLVQTSFDINILNNTITPNPNTSKNVAIKVEGVALSSTSFTKGDRINICNNIIKGIGISIPYAIEIGGHLNTIIKENIINGTPTSYDIRVWDNADTCKINQNNKTRIATTEYLNGYNNVSFVPKGATSYRPLSPSIGMLFLDTTLSSIIYFDGVNWKKVKDDSVV